MTYHLAQNLYVKVTAGYVALGYLVIQITYFGVYCNPFPQYWAFPVSNIQCATYSHYSITQAVFNISSDAMMLAIPIPILLKVQLPKSSKIVLVAVFSLGIFVILAAILNKYTNFASPLTTTYMIWYIRESSTAIYVANIMCWWPLLRKFFGMRTFSGDSSGRGSGVVPVRKLIKRISNFDVLADGDYRRGGFRGYARRMRATKLPSALDSSHSKHHRRTDTEAEVGTHCFPRHTQNIKSTPGQLPPRSIPLEIWRQVDVEVENREAPSRSSVRCKLFEHISDSCSRYKASVPIRTSPDPLERTPSKGSVSAKR
ncbi:MAG: hypothetical protein M1812_005924 [Candelaria pacifica]|nr:MAG: hypothetical protein M1812_005924 [Candelaria pacifica]